MLASEKLVLALGTLWFVDQQHDPSRTLNAGS
jgi:hypothetical protein